MANPKVQIKFTPESDTVNAFKVQCALEGVSMASEIRQFKAGRFSAKPTAAKTDIRHDRMKGGTRNHRFVGRHSAKRGKPTRIAYPKHSRQDTKLRARPAGSFHRLSPALKMRIGKNGTIQGDPALLSVLIADAIPANAYVWQKQGQSPRRREVRQWTTKKTS
jgi:hypothetical protein